MYGNVTNLAIGKNIPIFGPCLGFSNEETGRAFRWAADRVVYSSKDAEAASFKHHQNLIKGAGRWLRQSSSCFVKQEDLRLGGDLGIAGHPLKPNWCSLDSEREMSKE